MGLDSFLRKKIGIPAAERLKGWPVRRYLRELEESQWRTPEQIRALQNEKLALLIDHAYNSVPYYRQVMDERGLTPADIRGVDDLSKLPLLTKETFRAQFPDGMISSKYDAGKLVTMTSSGSTGEPFKYYMSEDEKARKWAGLFRFWSWSGWSIGDRYAFLMAFPIRAFKNNKIAALIEDRFSGLMTIPAFQFFEEDASGHVDRLLKFRPLMLRGYASSIYHLAQIVQSRGLNMSLRAVCSTGETLFDFQREFIESVMRCKVFDGYGSEGMEIAGQCDAGGYHVNAESVIVEIIGADDKPCPAGIPGRVILTDLNHYSMPFIRYDVQDVATGLDSACSCGRGLPVLKQIVGRLADIGVTPSGKGVVVHHFTVLFMKNVGAVDAFQVVQEEPDLFIISVVPGPRFEELRSQVLETLQVYLGNDVKIELKPVDRIPVTRGGKRRLFISKCGVQGAGQDPRFSAIE